MGQTARSSSPTGGAPATVTAAQAAILAGVSERTVRTWLASGRLRARKLRGRGPARWAISLEALAGVEGVALRHELLAHLAASGAAPDDLAAAPDQLAARLAPILARVAVLETEIAELREQLHQLRPSRVSVPVLSPLASARAPLDPLAGVGGDPRERATAPASYLAPPSIPSPPVPRSLPVTQPLRRPAPALSAHPTYPAAAAGEVGETFRTRADAARWLMRHGLASVTTAASWPGWREVELTPRAVLAFALALPSDHRRTWRLHPCDVAPAAGCVCAELLGSPGASPAPLARAPLDPLGDPFAGVGDPLGAARAVPGIPAGVGAAR